jgi:hypothetical protein
MPWRPGRPKADALPEDYSGGGGGSGGGGDGSGLLGNILGALGVDQTPKLTTDAQEFLDAEPTSDVTSAPQRLYETPGLMSRIFNPKLNAQVQQMNTAWTGGLLNNRLGELQGKRQRVDEDNEVAKSMATDANQNMPSEWGNPYEASDFQDDAHKALTDLSPAQVSNIGFIRAREAANQARQETTSRGITNKALADTTPGQVDFTNAQNKFNSTLYNWGSKLGIPQARNEDEKAKLAQNEKIRPSDTAKIISKNNLETADTDSSIPYIKAFNHDKFNLAGEKTLDELKRIKQNDLVRPSDTAKMIAQNELASLDATSTKPLIAGFNTAKFGTPLHIYNESLKNNLFKRQALAEGSKYDETTKLAPYELAGKVWDLTHKYAPYHSQEEVTIPPSTEAPYYGKPLVKPNANYVPPRANGIEALIGGNIPNVTKNSPEKASVPKGSVKLKNGNYLTPDGKEVTPNGKPVKK